MSADALSKDYRENAQCAVYLLGDLNQQMVDRLTLQIIPLRQASEDPITAYIDSQGGDINASENLRDLLKAPNQDGEKRRLITVVTGYAASAAADFLALGDYAIAYPHASIVYHGTRRPSAAPLTVEGASSLASSLRQSNEFFAIRLARRAFDRFPLRMMQLSAEFQQYINAKHQPLQSPDIRPLIAALGHKLREDKNALVAGAIQRQAAIDALTQSVREHLAKAESKDQIQGNRFEMEILKAILSYKINLHATEDWRLSNQGMAEVSADFYLLHDFHFGRQTMDLDRLTHIYGKIFLTTEQITAYDAMSTQDEEKRLSYLKQHAQPKIRPLWYFMVSLCRLLQSSDYWFDSDEAYWLGLVDEVPGTDLLNQRQLVEGQTPSS